MKVTKILNKAEGRNFSFEVLPPLKGNGTATLFDTIERISVGGPLFINITNHHSEYVYKELPGGQFERLRVRRRPGSIAIAGAIQNRFDIPVVPHVICSGISREDIEYELLDLQFLGIDNLLLLRGDKAKEDRVFTPVEGGYEHTTDLMCQVTRFNDGFFLDDSRMKRQGAPFCLGVACYPEKHEEAPNIEMDIEYLKRKQDLGAEYAITQLFYDNEKFFAFLNKARVAGITIPIIPAIKPLAKLSQLSVVPRTFHVDLPEDLAREAMRCRTDDDAKALGIEWGTAQCRDLYERGVKSIHFYTISAVDSVIEITKRCCSAR